MYLYVNSFNNIFIRKNKMKINIIKSMTYENNKVFFFKDLISNLSDNSIFSISCNLFSSK